MSKIDKLSILGIRSFDNQRSETIQFLSPLTLVVGHNGSGKTTIIECLKYATTGILPANSKTGGAFIHDPKLCGEKEVLAQVKISFKASTGAKMVATRSLQLTVKKLTRSQKTLEGSLLMVKDGERTAISSRVAELDLILPQYLGVSTAILDNVIFCHQDDSLWPISEPSNLKKKFDEIFEAQKYTKAIENIKQLRKKQGEELAKYKILEQHAKEDKDKAERTKKKSIQLSDEIEGLRGQVMKLEKQIEKTSDLANKAWKHAESYSKVVGALEGKRIEARSKQSTIDDLQAHLREVSESDEWLESTLNEYELRLEQYAGHRETKQEQNIELKDQIENLRQRLGQKHIERGQHEHDKAENARQLERRKQTVREVASKHQMRGYDDLDDESQVEEFMFKIRRITADKHTALDRAKREAELEKREAQSLVNRLTERKAALQDSKISAKKQIALNDREAGEYQKRVNQISVDEGSKAIVESRIEDLSSRMKKAKDSGTTSDRDMKIQEASTELRSYEDESSRLNNELVQNTKKAGEMARLAHLKQELKERQRSLETLLNAHTERINKLIGSDWQSRTIEEVHQASQDAASQELVSAERARDVVAREMEQLQFKFKTARDERLKKRKEMKEYDKAVQEAIEADPSKYDEVLTAAEDQLEMARAQVGTLKGMSDYFEKVLQVANHQDHPTCRVCERPFRGDTDPSLVKMKKKLVALIEKATKQTGEANLERVEEVHQRVVDAAIPLGNWKRLGEIEIPSLEKEEESFAQKRESMLAQIEQHDKIVDKRQTAKRDLEQIHRTVSAIGKCQTEIGVFEAQIEEAAGKQSQHAATRTLDDIQQNISNLMDKIRAAKQILTRLTTEKEQYVTEMSSLEIELRDLKNDLNTATYQLEKKASLAARVDEFGALNQKQRDALEKAEKDIGGLEPEILTARAKYDDVVQRTDVIERDLARESRDLSESVNALELLNGQISSYMERGGLQQLSNTQREIKRIEQDIKQFESEQNEISREINSISEQLRDSENTKIQYLDNLRFRRASRDLARLKDEIGELASQNAEEDRDRFQEESERLSKEHNTLQARQAGVMGEMKSKDVQLEELLADYETDFKDAPKRYKEAHIRVETTKAAVEDLGRYGGALDKAIMKYHSIKMEEINRIIEELWQRTYQGTDVDTIMIKSDNEGARGNRSYNYRVVMVKQDAEMDMRGRCSAGQKVLASIIIRLALAECFGTNCGLIALDEPTTNLDRDNIRALAESLHDIIKHRQQQANFQLIVITHDEEFLRHMQCGDFADYYYRVSRDVKCNSIIERQSIAEVM